MSGGTVGRGSVNESAGTFSRRALVGTALWSVPVVTIATAAPAFAASGRIALTFVSGATWIETEQGWVSTEENDNLEVFFFNVVFDGAMLLVDGDPTPSTEVTMTVTFSPEVAAAGADELYSFGDILGWTLSRTPSVFVYSLDSVVSGTTPLDGKFISARIPSTPGTFIFTFAVDGVPATVASFVTPPLPS